MNKMFIWVLLFYMKETSSGSWNWLNRTGGGMEEKGMSTCHPALLLKRLHSKPKQQTSGGLD